MKADIHVSCGDCKSTYAVKRITDTIEVPLTHCIFCGSVNIRTGNEEPDYWQSLALDLGLSATSGPLVKDIFDIWTPSDGDPVRFIDFARTMIKEAQVATGS